MNGDSMLKKIRLVLFFIFLLPQSFSSLADGSVLLKEVGGEKGSNWFVEKKKGGYNLKFISAKGVVYNNESIITQDLEGENIFLNSKSDGDVVLVMDYPKDIYSFEFSSVEVPVLLSACKQITLPSIDASQVVTLMTLCSRMSNIILSDIDADKLFESNNLVLNGEIKTLVGGDKVFIYNEDGKKNVRNSYLVKGDVIEVLGYKNSMLKIRYKGKLRNVIGWIRFEDVL